MGTRNLIMVIDQEGTKKVAQYGQWDGYPSGVGVDILNFLRNKELFEIFKDKLDKVRLLDEHTDQEFIKNFDKKLERDKLTKKENEWFENFVSRDLSAKVLTNIANSRNKEIRLIDSEEDAKKWVAWSYCINLKSNTFEVDDFEIYKTYSLDSLPTNEEFVSELEGQEEE